MVKSARTAYPGAASKDSRVVAIVVTYNSHAYIKSCTAALIAAGVDRIVLVDNNSVQSSRAVLVELQRFERKIHLVDSHANVGFGAAVNLGIRQSMVGSEDFLWIINPDLTVAPDSLSILRQVVEDGLSDVVSPLIFRGTEAQRPKSIWYGGGKFDRRRIRTEHFHRAPPSALSEVSFLTGAAIFLRKDTWDHVGDFCDDLFMYWEDAEWCLRAARLNVRMGGVSGALAFHDAGASSRTSAAQSELYHYFMQRNRIIVASSQFGRGALFTPSAVLETIRLAGRAAVRDDLSISKLFWSMRGIVDGFMGTKMPGRFRS